MAAQIKRFYDPKQWPPPRIKWKPANWRTFAIGAAIYVVSAALVTFVLVKEFHWLMLLAHRWGF